MSNIVEGKVVAIHFKLALDNGEQVDSSEGQEPLLYLHGAGNIPPGLEQALEGKPVGEEFDVHVSEEDGYGPRHPAGVQQVAKTEFPNDVEFAIGQEFGFEGEDGQVMPGRVVEIEADTVTIDLNHPLAGECLHFHVQVVEVRDATQEELDHGHPHGPGGHDH